MRRAAASEQGMVLLEVLAALTIFAVVSLSLVIALDRGLTAARERNQIDAAMRGLENQLSLLRGAPLALGDQAVPDTGDGFHYRVKVEPQPMMDQAKQPVLNLYRATVSVTWTDDGQAEEREVSQLFYQP